MKKDVKIDHSEERAEKKHDKEVAIKEEKLEKEIATELEKEDRQAEATASHQTVDVAQVGGAGQYWSFVY